ncbi:MAG: protein kinase, partial [candidate division Zixibacteria bacterium]|nr:protein kinase [candidate division Zixibacteria bacterium]
VHFIASQYVDGVNLGEWLSQKRRALDLDDSADTASDRATSSRDAASHESSSRGLGESARMSVTDVKQAADIIATIGEALEYAHERKIVHRDVKPANIMMDGAGRPLLTDFGLARDLERTLETQVTAFAGTPVYMSPEQASPEFGKLDHRTDIFSLGVVLYEMITGRTPFDAEHEAAIHYNIINETPEPMSRYKSGVNAELQQIVDKALSKDQSLRYQHADEMLADLLREKRMMDSGVSAPSRIGSRISSGQTSSVRKLAISGGVVAVLIIVALVLKPWKFTIESTDEALAAENRLAIMYFDNIVDPADEKRLGEIVANLLISKLSNSDGIKVVSSQRLYDILKLLGHEGEKQINRDVATQIAKEAKARWMLTGSILRIEPTFVITAQLIEVPTGIILSSPEITGETGEDIFVLASKINSEITDHLLLPQDTENAEQNNPELQYTESAEAFRYYLESIDYHLKHKNIEAVKAVEKAIELDSNFTMAYHRHAIITNSRINIDKAVELIDRVNKKEQLLIRAEREEIYRNYDEAIKIFEQIIDQYPEEKGAYFSLGFIYIGFEKRNLPKAIELFEKTIEIDPLFKRSYNQLAYVYEKIGENEKSIWAINKYIELVPNEPNPYESRGELFGFQGEHQKALESFSKALEIDPNFIGSYRGMGKNNFALGNYVEVEKWLDKIVSYDDKSVRSRGRFV